MGGFEVKMPGMGGSRNGQDHHVYSPKYQVPPLPQQEFKHRDLLLLHAYQYSFKFNIFA